MLAYITPEEGGILQLLGGSGEPGPMGIPSFYDDSAGADSPEGEAAGDTGPSESNGTGPGEFSDTDSSPAGSFGGGSTGSDDSDPTGNVGGNIGSVGFGGITDPSFSSAGMGLSDAAMSSIGTASSMTPGFFGGPGYSKYNKCTKL